jgi:long-chain fatty acid transport protein
MVCRSFFYYLSSRRFFMNYRGGLVAALLAPLMALGFGAAETVQASGYAVFTQGASALGQGNAVTAHTDSPNTIFYNPALMNKLDGTQLDVGTTMIYSKHHFESSTFPGYDSSNESLFFPSTVYATHKFNDKVSAGLGIFNPFGLGTEWDDDWEGRFLATKSWLTTFNFNPVIAYQVIPSLSVAVGLDVIYLDATLERMLPASGTVFGIGQKFKGDGTGVGFNVAAAYDVTKDIAVGVSYRSEVEIDVDGRSSTWVKLTPVDSKGHTSVRLPQQLTAGVSYQVIDPLILEAGIRWEGWSAFRELKITLDNGQFAPPSERNWHDTLGMNFGGKYQVNDTLAVKAGYIYGQNAVPTYTFDPSIPDSDTHIFCVGTDLNYQPYRIALAYAYQHYVDRIKNNSVGFPLLPPNYANGKYQSDAHLFSLELGYKF